MSLCDGEVPDLSLLMVVMCHGSSCVTSYASKMNGSSFSCLQLQLNLSVNFLILPSLWPKFVVVDLQGQKFICRGCLLAVSANFQIIVYEEKSRCRNWTCSALESLEEVKDISQALHKHPHAY